jgi:hypothetical protein
MKGLKNHLLSETIAKQKFCFLNLFPQCKTDFYQFSLVQKTSLLIKPFLAMNLILLLSK